MCVKPIISKRWFSFIVSNLSLALIFKFFPVSSNKTSALLSGLSLTNSRGKYNLSVV